MILLFKQMRFKFSFETSEFNLSSLGSSFHNSGPYVYNSAKNPRYVAALTRRLERAVGSKIKLFVIQQSATELYF